MIVKPADISRELSVILMYLISLIARPGLSVIFRVYVPGAWWCTSAVGCGNIKQIKPSIIVKWLFFSITCREERYCGNQNKRICITQQRNVNICFDFVQFYLRDTFCCNYFNVVCDKDKKDFIKAFDCFWPSKLSTGVGGGGGGAKFDYTCDTGNRQNAYTYITMFYFRINIFSVSIWIDELIISFKA